MTARKLCTKRFNHTQNTFHAKAKFDSRPFGQANTSHSLQTPSWHEIHQSQVELIVGKDFQSTACERKHFGWWGRGVVSGDLQKVCLYLCQIMCTGILSLQSSIQECKWPEI